MARESPTLCTHGATAALFDTVAPHVAALHDAEETGRAGLLVPVLPQGLNERGSAIWLVYPAQKSIPPRVRALRNYVLSIIEQEPSILTTKR